MTWAIGNQTGGRVFLFSQTDDFAPTMTSERDFENLLTEISACRVCEEHLPLGPRPVVQASLQAPILLVGQAPGRRVHESGVPFDDPSGDRLRTWLGVDRETFYDPTKIAIVPMGFCFPGTGKSGDLPPRPECAETWLEQVLTPMTKVRLTVVMGAYALKYHLNPGRRSLTEVVRDWESFWPQHIPLPHPSPRNIRWFKTNPWFEGQVIPHLQARVAELLAAGD
jgi:uracil-DNA glycosylase